ncbi:DUF6941 family protein [Patescibacteria group bacterium]
MKLKTHIFSLCDYASVTRDGKMNLMGVFRQLFIEELPAQFVKFYIAASIEGKPDSKHRIHISIHKPNGKLAVPREDRILYIGPAGIVNLITDILNMPIDNIGDYTIKITTVNKELIGKSKFQVINLKEKQKVTN